MGLEGVREAARRNRKLRFTALLHHVTPSLLVESFHALRRQAAAGVDGVTWREYEKQLYGRVHELHREIQSGAYRAQPSRRVYIPKADGRLRPLGIAALEDKIVQQAVSTVLSAIYEQDFLGFSYGFRQGRGQHDALDALSIGIQSRKVNWVLDADIRKRLGAAVRPRGLIECIVVPTKFFSGNQSGRDVGRQTCEVEQTTELRGRVQASPGRADVRARRVSIAGCPA
ncbi:reverse transcriptase domain-containing protein [Burkholderia sp. JSH-S8]|nr:reverse transcriptase domain-containing protein [Burkholderia sp. JSH-S8]